MSVHHFDDPVQQEVWDTLRALNDAWTKGNPDDLARYFHRDMVAITPMARHRVNGGAACVEGWKGFARGTRILYWQEIDPVIHVYGESAVVAYDFQMSYNIGEQTVDTGGRDMFFFVKQEGRWWVVADQFSGYPY